MAHWPEYLIEAALLAVFMVSACGFGVLLGYPASPVVRRIPSGILRRGMMGLAMGLTAIALIYSSWGKQSGAHMNPAVTLSFWWLGKVRTADAVMYMTAQVAGGVAGVALSRCVLGRWLKHPRINHVATLPGRRGGRGLLIAWSVELVISFMLLSVVLRLADSPRLMPIAGLAAGGMVAVFILVAVPWSGMSMNPARSLGSAVFARAWRPLWVYFTAPPVGMMLAAALFASAHGPPRCAKVNHMGHHRCIFNDCRWGETREIGR
jgi:aquaporin Z